MGKSKKQPSSVAQPQEEASNKAETVIISDKQPILRSSSKRRSIRNVQPGEIVTVHNKENGAVNRMAGALAVKLVERGEGVYEILR